MWFLLGLAFYLGLVLGVIVTALCVARGDGR